MQQPDEVPTEGADNDQAFVLPDPARKGRRMHDVIELFRPTIPASPDDEFWTSRPYQPNAREASLIALGLGVLGLLIMSITRWFPVFLACSGGLGVAAIMAGTILNIGRYQNPWWRIPSLLAIAFGLIELGNVAAWLNSSGP
jgi:hypothetical protein